jgi:hypothetical protein
MTTAPLFHDTIRDYSIQVGTRVRHVPTGDEGTVIDIIGTHANVEFDTRAYDGALGSQSNLGGAPLGELANLADPWVN